MELAATNNVVMKNSKANDMNLWQKIKFLAHFISKVLLYVIFFILIIIFVLFLLYFVDMIHNLKNGVTKQPLFSAYVIISPSMVPTIKVEDAIIVQRQETKNLKVGDIITFVSSDPRYSGITITHRIVRKEKTSSGEVVFRTKGDANNTEDSALVKASDIYGKVILKIPKIGYIQYFLTQAYGWIIAVVIPCLGVIIYDIMKLFKLIAKSKNNNKNGPSKMDNEVI
jgi:signal peptidase